MKVIMVAVILMGGVIHADSVEACSLEGTTFFLVLGLGEVAS